MWSRLFSLPELALYNGRLASLPHRDGFISFPVSSLGLRNIPVPDTELTVYFRSPHWR